MKAMILKPLPKLKVPDFDIDSILPDSSSSDSNAFSNSSETVEEFQKSSTEKRLNL